MKRLQGASGLELAGGELGLGTGQAFNQLGGQFGATMANTAATLGQLGTTEQTLNQNVFDKEYANQLAQYSQPYEQLRFQAGLLAGAAPSFLSAPTTQMGNPLLAGIGALGGYAG